jgi:hypothetical protein
VGLIGTLAVMAWAASVDWRLRAHWRRSLDDVWFPERYPETLDNRPGPRKLGTAIGVNMVRDPWSAKMK